MKQGKLRLRSIITFNRPYQIPKVNRAKGLLYQSDRKRKHAEICAKLAINQSLERP